MKLLGRSMSLLLNARCLKSWYQLEHWQLSISEGCIRLEDRQCRFSKWDDAVSQYYDLQRCFCSVFEPIIACSEEP